MPDSQPPQATRKRPRANLTYHLQCDICGGKFEAAAPNVHRCTTCERAFQRVRALCTAKHRRLGTPHLAAVSSAEAIHALKEAVARNMPVEGADKIVAEKEPPPSVGSHPCPYCGREVKGRVAYCPRCMANGFNHLHGVTGRTNGWDHPVHHNYRCLRKRAG